MDEAMAEILRIRARLAELEALVAKPIDMNELIRARAGRGIAAPTAKDMNRIIRRAAGRHEENTDDAA